VGAKTVGDLRVTLSFEPTGEVSMTVEHWDSTEEWSSFASVSGEGCNGDETLCVVCNEGEIPGGPWSVLNVASEQFVEFGITVDDVVGQQPDFTTIQLRTAEDIAFGYFADGN
jgi:hypothetical protein